jgi:mRNA-degrading endonuclease toxin of MazEF toxin-antitoxin module
VRVAAIRALAKFERSDLGALYGELSKEKIPEIQEALQTVVDFRPAAH